MLAIPMPLAMVWVSRVLPVSMLLTSLSHVLASISVMSPPSKFISIMPTAINLDTMANPEAAAERVFLDDAKLDIPIIKLILLT